MPLLGDAVDGAALGVAAVALIVSAAAFIVSLWDRFFAEPDIWPSANWVKQPTYVALSVTLLNTGYRKGAVRMVGLRSRAADVTWTDPSVHRQMPVVVDADGAAGPYVIANFHRDVLNILAGGGDAKLDVLVQTVRRSPRYLGTVTKRKLSEPKTFHPAPPIPSGWAPESGPGVTVTPLS